MTASTWMDEVKVLLDETQEHVRVILEVVTDDNLPLSEKEKCLRDMAPTVTSLLGAVTLYLEKAEEEAKDER